MYNLNFPKKLKTLFIKKKGNPNIYTYNEYSEEPRKLKEQITV